MDYISIVLDQLREATKMMKIGETFEQGGKDGEGYAKSPHCIGTLLVGREKVYFVEVKNERD